MARLLISAEEHRRACQETRPFPAEGRFPCHPVGEGLAPPASFRNFFGQRWGFALRGGAPSRRALRASWSAGGGRVRVPPLQRLRRITAKTDNGRTLCAPTAAQGNHSRGERHFADGSPPKPTKTAATFPGTLQQYFAKIQLCNNHVAILRFCYTSPKPVDGGLALEYSMNTGKGSYAPTEWMFLLIIGIFNPIIGRFNLVSGRG